MTADLPESLADAWQPAGTKTGKSSVLIASINAETTLYEPVEPTPLADLSTSTIPIRSLFVVDLSISPSLSTIGISPEAAFEKAAPKAKAQFVDLVEDDGLIVEDTRETLGFEAPNGTEGRWYVLDVSYPLENETTDDSENETTNGSENEDDSDSPDRLPAEAHVAVWPTDSSFGVAGGTLPHETTVEVLDGSGRDIEPAAITPERDRDTISTLIQRLDLESGADD